MFLEGAFEQDGSAQKTLECSPAEDEARMRNHSCTLTPQVTQGQYHSRSSKHRTEKAWIAFVQASEVDLNTS